MVQYGNAFHNASVHLQDILGDKNLARTKFTNLVKELNTTILGLQNSTTIVDNFFKNLINYKNNRFSFIFIFVTIIISIAGVILLYWLFMIFTMKLKKCMFLNKIC